MKRIVIDIDDAYATVLTVTAIGWTRHEVNVSTAAMDLEKADYAVIDSAGKFKPHKGETNEVETGD